MSGADGVTIRLDGVPVAWARARRNKHGAHFTAPKVARFESNLKEAAILAMRGAAPYDCGLVLDMTAYMPIPESWSQRKKEDAAKGKVHVTSKPDLDNLVKGVKDALNKVAYVDDSRVVEMHVYKHYSNKPCVIVTVRPL